jgi:hypothetical protein
VAARDGLTLTGGAKPRLRKQVPRDWSREKASAFLNVLVDTCNVSQAARESGVSVSAAYARRKVDAGFRATWHEAIAIAYQRLELELLDRAFNGVEKQVTRRDGSEERMREYSNQLGLQLLKMHRDVAVEANLELPPSEIEEVRERLIQKIRRLKERRDSETAPDTAEPA